MMKPCPICSGEVCRVFPLSLEKCACSNAACVAFQVSIPVAMMAALPRVEPNAEALIMEVIEAWAGRLHRTPEEALDHRASARAALLRACVVDAAEVAALRVQRDEARDEAIWRMMEPRTVTLDVNIDRQKMTGTVDVSHADSVSALVERATGVPEAPRVKCGDCGHALGDHYQNDGLSICRVCDSDGDRAFCNTEAPEAKRCRLCDRMLSESHERGLGECTDKQRCWKRRGLTPPPAAPPVAEDAEALLDSFEKAAWACGRMRNAAVGPDATSDALKVAVRARMTVAPAITAEALFREICWFARGDRDHGDGVVIDASHVRAALAALGGGK